MRVLTTTVTVIAASFAAGAAWAHGDVSCNEPRSEWRARVELQKKLKAEGWTIRDIRIENGCYEVYGFDEKEARVAAFFNPRTFERVRPGTSAARAADESRAR